MDRQIFIMGLPGAGKTTLAWSLALLLNAIVFNAALATFSLRRVTRTA